MNIDEIIREKNFKQEQLDILVRKWQPSLDEPLPYLQVFINAAVDYAKSVLKTTPKEKQNKI